MRRVGERLVPRFRDVIFFGLPIRKSLSCLPSLIAAVSHLGFFPLPDHFSPCGPLYFGATLYPFLGPPRCSLFADEVGAD